MMGVATKNSLRQVKYQLGAVLAVMVIIGVAIGFYSTLKAASDVYQTAGERHFATNNMPSGIIAGQDFTTADRTTALQVAGVQAVELRSRIAAKQVASPKGDKRIRVHSYDTTDPKVNIPYIYQGRSPNNPDECLLHERYARANEIAIGDTVTVNLHGSTDSCTVVGLATTPEDAYLTATETSLLSDPAEFGVVYVDTEFISRNKLPFTELAILVSENSSLSETVDAVADSLPAHQVTRVTKRDEIYSYSAFKADVQQFAVFAYIFPTTFFIIAAVVIYVSQRRNVLRDRRQIGVLKAMGLTDGEITRHYLLYALTVVFGGIGVALALNLAAGPWLVNKFNNVLDVPGFSYPGPFGYLLWPILFAIVLCLVSSFLAVRRVVQIPPAEAMHAEKPPAGRDLLLQKTALWDKLHFNTRYSIKAALRNRGRFWATVAGMTATVALLVTSSGFMDSFLAMTSQHFDKEAAYDLTVEMAQPQALYNTPAWLTNNSESYEKVLALPVNLGESEETMLLSVSDTPYAMRNFTDATGHSPEPGDGIVLPDYFADSLGLAVGDTIHVSTHNKQLDDDLTVTGITEQTIGFTGLMTYDTARKHGIESESYNLIYLRVKPGASVAEAKEIIEKETVVASVSSTEDDKASMLNLTKVFYQYIIMLVLFSLLLGVATLYSIASISLLARQYEFILLRVMGYSRGEIIRAYTKELLLQAVVALPVGFALGYVLINTVDSAFSTESMIFRAHIAPLTYLYAALLLLAIIGVVILEAWRQLNKQKLVEGVKAREE